MRAHGPKPKTNGDLNHHPQPLVPLPLALPSKLRSSTLGPLRLCGIVLSALPARGRCCSRPLPAGGGAEPPGPSPHSDINKTIRPPHRPFRAERGEAASFVSSPGVSKLKGVSRTVSTASETRSNCAPTWGPISQPDAEWDGQQVCPGTPTCCAGRALRHEPHRRLDTSA